MYDQAQYFEHPGLPEVDNKVSLGVLGIVMLLRGGGCISGRRGTHPLAHGFDTLPPCRGNTLVYYVFLGAVKCILDINAIFCFA